MFQTLMGSCFENDCGYFPLFPVIQANSRTLRNNKRVEICFMKKCNANESGQHFAFVSFPFLQPRKGLLLL